MNVKSLKVAELKEELSKRGLDTKGLKKDVGLACDLADRQLADRLQSFLDEGQGEPKAQQPDRDAAVVAGVDVAPVAEKQQVTEEVSIPAPKLEQVEDDKSQQLSSIGEAKPPSPQHREVPSPERQPEKLPQLEQKEAEEPTLSPVAATPVPAPQSSGQGASENDGGDADMVIDEEGDAAAPSASASTATLAVDKSTSDTIPLPSSLSHLALSYPPSKILYISNLRRPLLLSSLWDLLQPTSLPNSPIGPHSSSSSSPGLWLSGVKDHAYAGYDDVTAALAVAEKVHDLTWPESSSAKLGVQFIDPDQVSRLIEEEEKAWGNRLKLELKVHKEGERWSFDLIQPGKAGPIRGVMQGLPPPPEPLKEVLVQGELRWTRTRPSLAFKEGPGAPARPVRGRGGGRGGRGMFGGGREFSGARGGYGGGFGGPRGPDGPGFRTRGGFGGRGGRGPLLGDHWSAPRGERYERRGRW